MKDSIKKLFRIFLVCHFLISLTIGVLGMIFGKGQMLEYKDMFYPTIIAFVCTLPAITTIHPDRLKMSQIIVRKLLQMIIVEVIVCFIVFYGSEGVPHIGELLAVILAVLVIFVGVSAFHWIVCYMEAKELNRGLAEMQKNKN